MLSHILGEVPAELVDKGNKPTMSREQIVHAFMGKAESQDDQMLAGQLEKALTIPATSILFNIDQKADKSNASDMLLYAFVRVFDEARGFYGKNPYVAKFERDLASNGYFEDFKQEFEQVAGKPWSEGRGEAVLWDDEICEAYAAVTGKPEQDSIIQRYEDTYTMTVGDFADDVNVWLSRQEPNRRILFLVDEVGQFIGENRELMLSLQSIAEDLAVKTNGRAWVVVTSQEDMDTIVGDRTKQQSYDFSKIQGRFDTRLSLSSANVDEVIRKRILEKNAPGKETLTLLYDDKATVIKNLVVFNDGVEKKLYSDRENFSAVYPFIPYQFNLLGSVLTAIRTHGASGKHLAEGERSMLAMFKESAVRVMEQTPGALVPFNMFYDALEQFLDHSHKGVITRALDNEYLNPEHDADCFDVNVLKALFMIKYVKEITANVNNITSLMVSGVNEDRMELTQRVEEALKRLVRQTLVQKNGEIYVFLTDEEQEINRAIEGQDVDPSEVNAKVSELIFDGIYDEKKYRYAAFNGRYQFGFNQIVDDRPYKANQSYDITLHILTPNSDEAADEPTMRMLSGQSRCVLVVLPNDRTFLDEIRSALKIEKFIRFDAANAVTKFEQIKEAKKVEMRERSASARLFLTEAMREAAIYVNGDRAQSSAKEISSRINDALGKLVAGVYHKLPYIDTAMGENDIRKLFREQNQQLTLNPGAAAANELALRDVNDYIASNTARHLKTSMKSILDRFTKAPYGFIEADVQWLVARLFKSGDIALYVNNEAVTLHTKTEDELLRCLTRKEYNEKLMAEKRVKANEKQKKAVREVMKELFRVSSASEEDDALMSSFMKYADSLKTELEKLEIRCSSQPQYPGKSVIQAGKRLVNLILPIRYPNEFFSAVDSRRDDLLDFAEDYEPVKKFFAGDQLEIFDRAIRLMGIFDESKTFIVNEEIEGIAEQVKAIMKKPAPYSEIFRLPGLLDQYVNTYGAVLQEMEQPVLEAIDEAKARVAGALEGKACREQLSGKLHEKFMELREKATHCNNVATLQNIKVEADALKVRCLNEINDAESRLMARTAQEAPRGAQEAAGRNPGAAAPEQEAAAEPALPRPKKQKTVSIRAINTSSTWQLESAEDVRRCVAELQDRLMKALEEDTVVNIEF